jgi:hypothetical protein
MVDLIYVLIYLVISIFSSAGVIDSAQTEEAILGQGMIRIAFDLIGFGGEQGIVMGTTDSFASIVSSSLGALAGGITSVFARFVIALAVLVACVKLFWTVLKSYVGIILNIVFAPIILLPNAIPGSKSFSKWLMSLLSGVIIFPLTAVIFIIASALSNNSVVMGVNANAIVSGEDQALKVPFLIGGGGIKDASLLGLVGFGILMVAPNLLEMAQKAVGGESPLAALAQPLAQNVGMGLKGATAIPRRVYKSNEEMNREYAQENLQRDLHGQGPIQTDPNAQKRYGTRARLLRILGVVNKK